MNSPHSIVDLDATMFRKGTIMTVSETMALSLLVAGGLSLYLIIHAVVDLYRHGLGEKEEP